MSCSSRIACFHRPGATPFKRDQFIKFVKALPHYGNLRHNMSTEIASTPVALTLIFCKIFDLYSSIVVKEKTDTENLLLIGFDLL